MERRKFLNYVLNYGSSLLILQLLGGCGNKQKNQQMQVMLLKGSIPSQIVARFNRILKESAESKFYPVGQINALFKKLQGWESKTETDNKNNPISQLFSWLPFINSDPGIPDLVTLGDYWVKNAIKQKLIQPIDNVSNLDDWKQLDDKWKQLVRRNDKGDIDSTGKIWGAPYRWGSTVIIYRKDKFEKLGWEPQDWNDLFKPELQNRISVLNQPRETVGLVLKKLGKSYNTQNLDTVPQLKSEIKNLSQQVKFYSSDRYIEPLLMGDTWLAVGWSNDILSIISRYPQLDIAVPSSGTALWVDLWVRPAKKGDSNSNPGTNNQEKRTQEDLFYKWINFCWETSISKQIALITKANSPAIADISTEDISESFKKVLQGNSKVLSKSEFLEPLPPEINQEYDSLFADMKES